MNFIFLDLDQRNIQFLHDILRNPVSLTALLIAFVGLFIAIYDPLIIKRGEFVDIFKTRISTIAFLSAATIIALLAILSR